MLLTSKLDGLASVKAPPSPFFTFSAVCFMFDIALVLAGRWFAIQSVTMLVPVVIAPPSEPIRTVRVGRAIRLQSKKVGFDDGVVGKKSPYPMVRKDTTETVSH